MPVKFAATTENVTPIVMASFTITIDKYILLLDPNTRQNKAQIKVFGDGHEITYYFTEPPVGLQDNQYHASTKTGSIRQHMTYLSNYVDLLRNESPVYLSINANTTPPTYLLKTNVEAPGEGE